MIFQKIRKAGGFKETANVAAAALVGIKRLLVEYNISHRTQKLFHV
jgi:hypothetical protein